MQGDRKHPIGRYLQRVGLAFNQCISAIFGGEPDETISARTGRRRYYHRILAWFAGKAFSDKHYEGAIENERRGRTQDAIYRPDAFITRRAALQVLALMDKPAEPTTKKPKPRTVALDRDIRVTRGDKVIVIDADAMWHALESAIKMPLVRGK